MNGQANSCVLSLNNVYVENIIFHRTESYNGENVKLSFQMGSKVIKSSDNKGCKAVINTKIMDEEQETLNIEVCYVGLFGLDNIDKLNKKEQQEILHGSTLGILFPFLRSFITTITSQSGLKPIILPPINIRAMLERNNELGENIDE